MTLWCPYDALTTEPADQGSARERWIPPGSVPSSSDIRALCFLALSHPGCLMEQVEVCFPDWSLVCPKTGGSAMCHVAPSLRATGNAIELGILLTAWTWTMRLGAGATRGRVDIMAALPGPGVLAETSPAAESAGLPLSGLGRFAASAPAAGWAWADRAVSPSPRSESVSLGVGVGRISPRSGPARLSFATLGGSPGLLRELGVMAPGAEGEPGEVGLWPQERAL